MTNILSLTPAVCFSLLMLTLQAPTYTAGLTRNVNNEDCSTHYIESYDKNVIPGFKILDAVQAERSFVRSSQQVS